MPDTKFSLPALREHLRKYLWIYLAGIALCLAGTRLLWTMTQPRLDIQEVVTVYMADTYSNPEPLSDIAADALAKTQPSDEALKLVEFESMLFDPDNYTSNILLLTRLAVGECDAFFASQPAMDALVNAEALVPLDDRVAAGWLKAFGLEPYYAARTDEDGNTGEPYLAGLRLDGVTALSKLEVFDNRGAFLCVANSGGNVETTMKALEYIMQDLTEASHAGTEAA